MINKIKIEFKIKTEIKIKIKIKIKIEIKIESQTRLVMVVDYILQLCTIQYNSYEGESKNLSTKQEKINTYC